MQDSGLRAALDYAGVAVFAATGALAAARKGHDILTFAFFAAVTGIGGGTIRDLLLGAPVFWVGDAGYVGVCIAAAGIVWAVGERAGRLQALLWLDAVGLAAYAVVGAAKAAAWGAPPLVSVVMGVLSASFGGVVRDVLAGEPSVLLRREIYVTAAVAGAAAFVLLRLIGLPEPVAGVLAVAVAFGLRAAALAWGWTLPSFGSEAAPVTLTVPMVASPQPIAPEPEPDPVPQPEAQAPAPRTRKRKAKTDAASIEPSEPARKRRPRKPKPDPEVNPE